MIEQNAETTRERAILIGLRLDGMGEFAFAASLEELKHLADTAGAEVAAVVEQKRAKPDAATYIGSGKVAEIRLLIEHMAADLVIVNGELSPVQIRNLENEFACKVIDRTQLILDIFARHARTRESQLQVELALLQYMLPRLVGRRDALSRTGGGIGTRGPGEQKLEIDRRRIRERIADLKSEIDEIRRHRERLRSLRKKRGVPVIALVGYTNAGKSSLFNSLYSYCRGRETSPVEARDQLFATLEPTTRRIELPDGQPVLLTDTVGFIQQLPHHLVAAFRGTLEEVTEADLLLHVVDLCNPAYEQQMATVERVLKELDAIDLPTLVVYNKIDRLPHKPECFREDEVAVSALTGEGLDALVQKMRDRLQREHREYELCVPYREGRLFSLLHTVGKVVRVEETERGWKMNVRLNEAALGKLKRQIHALLNCRNS
ncbi:GTPase HflX [Bacillaceae bacterium]